MAAVSQWGLALEYAAEELQCDREIVMAAVSQEGGALQHANLELRSDREIVTAATSQHYFALLYAADALLEDERFAVKARQCFHFFKITTLSGQSCIVAEFVRGSELYFLDILVRSACSKLGMTLDSVSV